MIRIRVIVQRSVLVVFLAANSFNPLLALSTKVPTTSKRNQKVVGLFQEIKNILINKGLNEDAAFKKTVKLLQGKDNIVEKIYNFKNASELSISHDRLTETLAKYALHEKDLQLDSYTSFIGFTQSILERPLNHNELKYIQKIA